MGLMVFRVAASELKRIKRITAGQSETECVYFV